MYGVSTGGIVEYYNGVYETVVLLLSCSPPVVLSAAGGRLSVVCSQRLSNPGNVFDVFLSQKTAVIGSLAEKQKLCRR